MKRKWFTADAMAVRERLWRGLALGHEDHLGHVGRVGTVYHGSFRRRRFGITCESNGTGNMHAIAYDRCSPYDRAGPTLCRPGVEYLTVQSAGAGMADRIDGELRYLLEVTRRLLSRAGVGSREGQLSELVYRRGFDAGAGR